LPRIKVLDYLSN